MNKELVKAVFRCGIDNLDLLDGANCDFEELICDMRTDGLELSLNNIIKEMFERAKDIVCEAYSRLRKDLEKEAASDSLTQSSYDMLQAVRSIYPENDIEWFVNMSDTHFIITGNKEIYEDLFEEELEQVEEMTGFKISWSGGAQ